MYPRVIIRAFLEDRFRQLLLVAVVPFLIVASLFLRLIGSNTLSLKYAFMAHRASYRNVSLELIKSNSAFKEGSYWPLVGDSSSFEEAVKRSIVLRWPVFNVDEDKVVEKGIIIVTFTHVFSYYLRHLNVKEMSRYFTFILEPSWAGYSDPDILMWSHLSDGPVYVQASELKDRIFINALNSNLVPVSFGASDWVDHRLFKPLPNYKKKYDSIYVANTQPIKRVYRYLLAVRRIVDRGHGDYKACLVCAHWGGREEKIRNMISALGIQDNITFHLGLSASRLVEELNSSKVNILLSYREGSNRSLFESIFSGIPVILVAENIGVNKSYINEFTGLLVNDKGLEDALCSMRDKWIAFSACRDWALENIAPEVTANKIRRLLFAGQKDSRSDFFLYTKTNRPEVRYFDKPDLCFHSVNAKLLRLFSGSKAIKNIYQQLKDVGCEWHFMLGSSGNLQ